MIKIKNVDISGDTSLVLPEGQLAVDLKAGSRMDPGGGKLFVGDGQSSLGRLPAATLSTREFQQYIGSVSNGILALDPYNINEILLQNESLIIKRYNYDDFTYLENWAPIDNNRSVNAYRIGPCLFMSGAVNVGTRTRNTHIIQLPSDLAFSYNTETGAGVQYQYNFWHSFDSNHTPVQVREGNGYRIRIDNNFDIPDNINALVISGFWFVQNR